MRPRLVRIEPWKDLWRVTYTKPENGDALHFSFKGTLDYPDEVSVYQWWLTYSGYFT